MVSRENQKRVFKKPEEKAYEPKEIAELVKLIDDEVISVKIAKEVLLHLAKGEGTPSEIIENRGLKQIGDPVELQSIIDIVVESNPKNVELYRAGKTNLFGFFIGQIMKNTGGRAHPELVNELLKERAAISGKLVLSDFTINALKKFKK